MYPPIPARSLKNAVFAAGLEFLIPGAGFMYVRQVAKGIAVLIISLVGTLMWLGNWSAQLQTAGANPQCIAVNGFGTCVATAPDYSAANSCAGVFFVIGLVWLALRILDVVVRTQKYNAAHQIQPPAYAPMPVTPSQPPTA
jgi:hypothetical protein